MEYEIISNIASVWFFRNFSEVQSQDSILEMEFTHPRKNSAMKSWKILCALSDFANYGFSWNTHACDTILKRATLTHCVCYRTGTFAVLLTTEPSMVRLHEIRRIAANRCMLSVKQRIGQISPIRGVCGMCHKFIINIHNCIYSSSLLYHPSILYSFSEDTVLHFFVGCTLCISVCRFY